MGNQNQTVRKVKLKTIINYIDVNDDDTARVMDSISIRTARYMCLPLRYKDLKHR